MTGTYTCLQTGDKIRDEEKETEPEKNVRNLLSFICINQQSNRNFGLTYTSEYNRARH